MIEIIDQLGRKYVISWNMKDWHSSAMPAHRNPPMSRSLASALPAAPGAGAARHGRCLFYT
ncbi:MFS transporter, partial [Bordetella pertussis]